MEGTARIASMSVAVLAAKSLMMATAMVPQRAIEDV
jgi:hypothetical protein